MHQLVSPVSTVLTSSILIRLPVNLFVTFIWVIPPPLSALNQLACLAQILFACIATRLTMVLALSATIYLQSIMVYAPVHASMFLSIYQTLNVLPVIFLAIAVPLEAIKAVFAVHQALLIILGLARLPVQLAPLQSQI